MANPGPTHPFYQCLFEDVEIPQSWTTFFQLKSSPQLWRNQIFGNFQKFRRAFCLHRELGRHFEFLSWLRRKIAIVLLSSQNILFWWLTNLHRSKKLSKNNDVDNDNDIDNDNDNDVDNDNDNDVDDKTLNKNGWRRRRRRGRLVAKLFFQQIHFFSNFIPRNAVWPDGQIIFQNLAIYKQ